MTPHEQAMLEVRARMMHEALKWAYEQIPEAASYAGMNGELK